MSLIATAEELITPSRVTRRTTPAAALEEQLDNSAHQSVPGGDCGKLAPGVACGSGAQTVPAGLAANVATAFNRSNRR
jgi:hypothetical protein